MFIKYFKIEPVLYKEETFNVSAMITFRLPAMMVLCMLIKGSIRHFLDLEYFELRMPVSN